MDSGLKQRLVGAAVLVALAVIFLPMLVQGPAPDSGISDVPLTMPDAPRDNYETRDLPLVTPGNAPSGGALGMASRPVTPDAAEAAAAEAEAPTAEATPVSTAVPLESASTQAPVPLAAGSSSLSATTAGGDYAVAFGAYASTAAADAVIASLRASQLPGYREATTSKGKPAWRVRIGPYASRAEAEAARLRATHVRDDVGASVVALDAAKQPAPKPVATAAPQPPKPQPQQKPAAEVPAAPAKPAPAAANTGFAVQLAAYSKAADATALRDQLRAAGFSAFTESVDTDKGNLTRVRVGPVVSRAEAEQLQAAVQARTGVAGIVRPHP